MSDWNTQIVEEFRSNDGVVASFAPAYLVLLHHVGRKSGTEYVAPVRYFTDGDGDDDDLATMYVVASAAGAPTNPQWYVNLTAASRTHVEVGTPDGVREWDVRVEDLSGAERDRVFDAVKQEAEGFADYETKVSGARVIPVLALHRVD